MLVLSNVPLSAFASDGATITLGSNAQTDGTIDPAGVEFTYYVEINGAAVNDSYTGSDGEVYTAVNGNITLPYDVTVSIPVADGDSYLIYRYEYDNAAYALIEQSYAARGTIASYEYYYTVNGTEVSLTESEYNAATNNGKNLTINKYVTRDANGDIAEIYDESEVESLVGYDVIRTEGGTTVIYDTYTLEVTAVPDGYVLDDSASVLEVFAGENNGNYTLQAVYHLKRIHKKLRRQEERTAKRQVPSANTAAKCSPAVILSPPLAYRSQ